MVLYNEIMNNNQKLPCPKIADKPASYKMGSIQIPGDNRDSMRDSGISPEEAIEKLGEAVKKGVFEDLEENNEQSFS